MKKPTIITLLITLIVSSTTILYSFPSISAQYILITVQTDKQIYNVGEQVNINGTVIYNGQPLTNGLVAIEIDDRTIPILYRTVNTGADPTGPFKVEIVNAYLGDINRNPVANAIKGSTYFIWLGCKNNEATPVKAALCFTIMDPNNSPLLALLFFLGDVPTGGPHYYGYQWTVPSDAATGTATVYGNAYTDDPKNGGTPHCPEKYSTFNIVTRTLTTSESQKTTPTQAQLGSYNVVYKIPNKGARLGNYTVYANIFHLGFKSTATTTYKVILVGDVNNDLYVNVKDATLLGMAFGSKPGDPNWDERCDLNKDGWVNIKDAVILNVNFGNSAV